MIILQLILSFWSQLNGLKEVEFIWNELSWNETHPILTEVDFKHITTHYKSSLLSFRPRSLAEKISIFPEKLKPTLQGVEI